MGILGLPCGGLGMQTGWTVSSARKRHHIGPNQIQVQFHSDCCVCSHHLAHHLLTKLHQQLGSLHNNYKADFLHHRGKYKLGVMYWSNYTVSSPPQNVPGLTSCNLAKTWHIFKILSLLEIIWNLLQILHNIVHYTLHTLPHYLRK